MRINITKKGICSYRVVSNTLANNTIYLDHHPTGWAVLNTKHQLYLLYQRQRDGHTTEIHIIKENVFQLSDLNKQMKLLNVKHTKLRLS